MTDEPRDLAKLNRKVIMRAWTGYTYHADLWCADCVPAAGLREAARFDAGLIADTDNAALPFDSTSEWDYEPTCNKCGAALPGRVINTCAH